MREFLSAIALAIVLEGLLYAAFPDHMKRALAALMETPSTTMRVVALTSAAAGLVLLYVVRA